MNNIKNWGIAAFIAITAVIFVFIGNILYAALIAIFVITGKESIGSPATLISTVLPIIFSAFMIWLSVLSSKGYVAKKYGSYDPNKVTIYSLILFLIAMVYSIFGNMANNASGMDLSVGILRGIVLVAIFYLSTRHYINRYTTAVPVSAQVPPANPTMNMPAGNSTPVPTTMDKINTSTVEKPVTIDYKNPLLKLANYISPAFLFVVWVVAGISRFGDSPTAQPLTPDAFTTYILIYLICIGLSVLRAIVSYKKSLAKGHGQTVALFANTSLYMIILFAGSLYSLFQK